MENLNGDTFDYYGRLAEKHFFIYRYMIFDYDKYIFNKLQTNRVKCKLKLYNNPYSKKCSVILADVYKWNDKRFIEELKPMTNNLRIVYGGDEFDEYELYSRMIYGTLFAFKKHKVD